MKITYLTGSIVPSGTVLFVSNFSGVDRMVLGSAEAIKRLAPEGAAIEFDDEKVARVFDQIEIFLRKKRKRREMFYRRFHRRGERKAKWKR